MLSRSAFSEIFCCHIPRDERSVRTSGVRKAKPEPHNNHTDSSERDLETDVEHPSDQMVQSDSTPHDTVQQLSIQANPPKQQLSCCLICLNDHRDSQAEKIALTCGHSFCPGCLKKHIQVAVIDNKQCPIPCPMHTCTNAIEFQTIDHLDSALASSHYAPLYAKTMAHPYGIRFCPGCTAQVKMTEELVRLASSPMQPPILPNGIEFALAQYYTTQMATRPSVPVTPDTSTFCISCHSCGLQFCARCKVKWHDQMSCEIFESIKEDEAQNEVDVALFTLMSEKKWRRCRNCGWCIERIDGCNHMMCKCGKAFCFRCGSMYLNSRPSCRCNG